MIRSSACQQQADTHPALWDEPWSSKLHHVLGHDPFMLHYAGLSRARGLLHVLLPTSTRRAYDRQGEAFGRRLESRRTWLLQIL